jgi:hypothetical protein
MTPYPSVAAELAEIRRRIAADEADYDRDYPPASPERVAWAESVATRCFGPGPYRPPLIPRHP